MRLWMTLARRSSSASRFWLLRAGLMSSAILRSWAILTLGRVSDIVRTRWGNLNILCLLLKRTW